MATRTREMGGHSNCADEASIDAIQKACDLRLDADSATIQQAWDDLCQQFRRDHGSRLIDKDFPHWILHNIPGGTIEGLMRLVHAKNYGKINSCAPTLCKNLGGVPPWKLHLFLGQLPQNRVMTLFHATNNNPGITLDDVYEELCRIRSQKGTMPAGPVDFTYKEIQSIFSDRSPEDEYDDDFENESQEDDASRATGDGDDDYDYDSEHNTALSFDDTSFSHVNDNLSRCSRSPVMDDLGGYATSPVHASSSTSVASPHPDVNTARRSATDDTAILIAGQLDFGRRTQAVETEEHGANKLPYREPMVDISDCTVTDIQQQSARTNDTGDPRLVEIRNLLTSSIESRERVYEGLEQARLSLEREKAENSAHSDAEKQDISREFAKPWTREGHETVKESMSKYVGFSEKRLIIENKEEEYQVKRRRYDADIHELQQASRSISRFCSG